MGTILDSITSNKRPTVKVQFNENYHENKIKFPLSMKLWNFTVINWQNIIYRLFNTAQIRNCITRVRENGTSHENSLRSSYSNLDVRAFTWKHKVCSCWLKSSPEPRHNKASQSQNTTDRLDLSVHALIVKDLYYLLESCKNLRGFPLIRWIVKLMTTLICIHKYDSNR